jgi:hypothetical protein
MDERGPGPGRDLDPNRAADHHAPITWPEIMELLRARPLWIRRLIDGALTDPERFDPEPPP